MRRWMVFTIVIAVLLGMALSGIMREGNAADLPSAIKPVTQPLVTVIPTTAVPVSCEAGCECLDQSVAEEKGYQYCNGKLTVCGYKQTIKALVPMYCYQKPPPATTAPAIVACPDGCTCLGQDEAKDLGYPKCAAESNPCGYDQYQRYRYCYQKPVATPTTPVSKGPGTTIPTPGETLPATQATAPLTAPVSPLPTTSVTSLPTPPVWDLSIVSVEAVQVVYGAPLVMGKGTAFRVKVDSTFPSGVSTMFRLILPEDQWTVSANAVGNQLAFPPGYRYPETWGPVIIPALADDFEVMLPYIPDRERETTGEAAGQILEARHVGQRYGPDIRIVPMPKGSPVQFTVMLDSENTTAERDEGNNLLSSQWYYVLPTKQVKIYYAIHVGGNMPGHEHALGSIEGNNVLCPVTDQSGNVVSHESRNKMLVCKEAREHAKLTTEYLLGVGPIADRKIEYTIDCIIRDEATFGGGDYWGTMLAMARTENYEYVLSMEPCDCCGSCGIGSSICGIGMSGPPNNGAHELLGHGIQNIEYECYDPTGTDVNPGDCGASEGFWVNKWIPYQDGTWPSTPPTYYMDSTGDVYTRWQRLEQLHRTSDGSLLNGGYNQLITRMADAEDPKVILVRGTVEKDGTVHLLPFMILESGSVDLEPGSPGAYRIVLKENSGKVIDTYGFDLSFAKAVDTATGPMIQDLDRVSFVYRVEWKEGTAAIEIQDPTGKAPAERKISANTPKVRITSPKGGETWKQGETYAVTWDAEDNDSDVLSYALSLSGDRGATWVPLAIDLSSTTYSLSTENLEPGDGYLVKVRATDGVNTAEDVLSDPIQVIGVPPTTRVGDPVAIVFGVLVAVFTIGLHFRKRK